MIFTLYIKNDKLEENTEVVLSGENVEKVGY